MASTRSRQRILSDQEGQGGLPVAKAKVDTTTPSPQGNSSKKTVVKSDNDKDDKEDKKSPAKFKSPVSKEDHETILALMKSANDVVASAKSASRAAGDAEDEAPAWTIAALDAATRLREMFVAQVGNVLPMPPAANSGVTAGSAEGLSLAMMKSTEADANAEKILDIVPALSEKVMHNATRVQFVSEVKGVRKMLQSAGPALKQYLNDFTMSLMDGKVTEEGVQKNNKTGNNTKHVTKEDHQIVAALMRKVKDVAVALGEAHRVIGATDSTPTIWARSCLDSSKRLYAVMGDTLPIEPQELTEPQAPSTAKLNSTENLEKALEKITDAGNFTNDLMDMLPTLSEDGIPAAVKEHVLVSAKTVAKMIKSTIPTLSMSIKVAKDALKAATKDREASDKAEETAKAAADEAEELAVKAEESEARAANAIAGLSEEDEVELHLVPAHKASSDDLQPSPAP